MIKEKVVCDECGDSQEIDPDGHGIMDLLRIGNWHQDPYDGLIHYCSDCAKNQKWFNEVKIKNTVSSDNFNQMQNRKIRTEKED